MHACMHACMLGGWVRVIGCSVADKVVLCVYIAM